MKGKIDHTAIPGYRPPGDRKCRNCGDPMKPFIEWEEVPGGVVGEGNVVRRYGFMENPERPKKVLYYGYDYRELFCTLRCGYAFAVNTILQRQEAT